MIKDKHLTPNQYLIEFSFIQVVCCSQRCSAIQKGTNFILSIVGIKMRMVVKSKGFYFILFMLKVLSFTVYRH